MGSDEDDVRASLVKLLALIWWLWKCSCLMLSYRLLVGVLGSKDYRIRFWVWLALQKPVVWWWWWCSLTPTCLTGLPLLGWHWSPPELWIGTDPLSSCCQSWYLFYFSLLPWRGKKAINFKYICFGCSSLNTENDSFKWAFNYQETHFFYILFLNIL